MAQSKESYVAAHGVRLIFRSAGARRVISVVGHYQAGLFPDVLLRKRVNSVNDVFDAF